MVSTSARSEPEASHALAILAAEALSGEANSLERADLVVSVHAGLGAARTELAMALMARVRAGDGGASARATSRAEAVTGSALALVTTASRSGRSASACFAARAVRVLRTGLRIATADAADCAKGLLSEGKRVMTVSTTGSGSGSSEAMPRSASIWFRALPERTRSRRELASRAESVFSEAMRIALLERVLSVDATAVASCSGDR